MPATKTETATLPSLSEQVLIEYKPSIRELGVFANRFIALYRNEAGDLDLLEIRPGVWRRPRAEWEQWQSNKTAAVKHAIACGALRLISPETNLMKIDGFLAQEIVRNASDIELLKEWAKDYASLPASLQQALDHKQESMQDAPTVAAKYVFGNRVA